ncbi:amino-acid N-acetyltransferase [Georgenia soli]|uniref:amino-acid N-acetyltransferase n=1 Tax=Georgenia soli TaxID=638953 RepID=UPI002481D9E6|nr:amino-acid N-acetyltransferase [Georgenia soli]
MVVRQARPADVRAIYELVQPYAEQRILVAKELIDYFEAVQEFVVAEEQDYGGRTFEGEATLHVGPDGTGPADDDEPAPPDGPDDEPASPDGPGDVAASASPEGAAAGGGSDGPRIVGCGALHVLWDDIAEVRTLAVAPEAAGRGIGRRLLETLVNRARNLGLRRVFCLTFEVDFFRRHGFQVIAGTPVGTDVYAQMLRSHDDGVAEFLDLARVKPNTLGNSRMLLEL